MTIEPPEASPAIPAWVYRLDVEPPARHEGWRRAVRALQLRRRLPKRRASRG